MLTLSDCKDRLLRTFFDYIAVKTDINFSVRCGQQSVALNNSGGLTGWTIRRNGLPLNH